MAGTFQFCPKTFKIIPFGLSIMEQPGNLTEICMESDLKTVSPKRVVTIVHCTTISGHFLANPFNIFHKTEALLVILN